MFSQIPLEINEIIAAQLSRGELSAFAQVNKMAHIISRQFIIEKEKEKLSAFDRFMCGEISAEEYGRTIELPNSENSLVRSMILNRIIERALSGDTALKNRRIVNRLIFIISEYPKLVAHSLKIIEFIGAHLENLETNMKCRFIQVVRNRLAQVYSLKNEFSMDGEWKSYYACAAEIRVLNNILARVRNMRGLPTHVCAMPQVEIFGEYDEELEEEEDEAGAEAEFEDNDL